VSDRVFIKGLRAESVIGCYDWERDIRQALVVDLELAANFSDAAQSDALEDALDYAAISARITEVIEGASFQLLEALAEALVEVLQTEFGITGLRLTITKPGAVANADGVGVMVEHGEI